MFRLLAAAAVGEEEATNLAFQSLQLTCSDYMAAMPFVRLKRCLEVTVLFSSQQADVNVSLTTISLLWNAADLFGKAAPAAGRAGALRPGSALGGAASRTAATGDEESDTEVEAAVALPVPAADEVEESMSDEEAISPSSKRSQLAANLTAAQSEELLQMIFLALQARDTALRAKDCCAFCVDLQGPGSQQACASSKCAFSSKFQQRSLPHTPSLPCPAGRQPGYAARGPQQRRAHPVCRGCQPGPPPVARALGAVLVGNALPAAQPRLPHVCYRQPG